jgi:hypothetical protein
MQFAGDTTSGAYQSALRLDRLLGPVIGAVRFIGITSLFVAIGLALVAIVINLRATTLALLQAFSKLIVAAGAVGLTNTMMTTRKKDLKKNRPRST